MHIPLEDLRWYAAYHNEAHHPHCHIVTYSVGKEPYITEVDLMKLKSAYAGEIFKQDLVQIYAQQTQHRDDLSAQVREYLHSLVADHSLLDNEHLRVLMEELAVQLQAAKGKKVYIWQTEYLVNTKHSTKISYRAIIKNHIKPNLGAVALTNILPHQIQSFYNRLSFPTDGRDPTSPKTIKNIHGVLHRALQQAVLNGMIQTNPCNACVLPKVTRKEIKPLDEEQIADFLAAINGHRYEQLFITTIFSGMREGEVCGLQWDCINLERGTVLINKQLQKMRQTGGEYRLLPTKNSKGRSITLAPFVVTILRQVKKQQSANKLRYGEGYEDSGFVFTDELGHHLSPQIVYRDFKKVVTEIGCPDARFHDLRHTYAVVAIQSGDDIKTVQENLGHATAAFTLDVYGHVTDKMKQESAKRMERFIRSVTA